MRVLPRCRPLAVVLAPVLALVLVLSGLLAPIPAAAAADDVHLLAPAGPSGTPQYVRPLAQTATGLVYRNEHSGTTMVKLHGLAHVAQPETRLADPTVVGDLLSEYLPATRTLRWRTIADATLHETVLPADLDYLVRTPSGYLARQGAGPYELVAVDLLAGGTASVLGTAPETDGVIAGPLGAAVPVPGTPGDWRYHPYDASLPAGLLLTAPAGAGDCRLGEAALFCWSATELTRSPLTGNPATTVAASPRSLVPTATGAAWSTPDARYPDFGWHQIWTWRADASAPVLAVTGDKRLTGHLAPVTGGTDLALAAKAGDLSEAGMYRISAAAAVTLVIGTTPQPRAATTIALGPGRAVWGENAAPSGALLGRDVGPAADGGLSLGPTSQLTDRSSGTALSVGGWRAAYARTTGTRGLELTGVPGDPDLESAGAVRSTVSGDRVLWQSRGADEALTWHLTDLPGGATTALADGVSYDLWGERLARLDADGSVWVRDLRAASAPEQLAPALDGGAAGGTVHVAGDLVAWDVTPADPAAPDPGVLVRDTATADPATPLAGLSVLQDLSTGYAVGCGGVGGCSPRAVALADGTVFPVESDRPLVVDGNVLGFLTPDALPAVRVLPAYADAPRLLGPTGAPAEVDLGARGFSVRVTASEVLADCALEIRDAEEVLVRSVACTPARYGVATATWNGAGQGLPTVPDGTYTWRIVASDGALPLVGHDGSTSALGGTLVVDGPPGVTAMVPAPDAVAVAPGTTVRLGFDEPVSGATAATVELRGPDGNAVPGAVTYDAATRTVTLTPSAPLGVLRRYSVVVHAGVTDAQGNAVSVPDWSFSTGTTSTAPTCSLVMPARVVIDARSSIEDFRIAPNCAVNGADHASWDLVHAATGGGWTLRFESADFEYPDWTITWPDTAPMGRWSLVPQGAAQADGNPLRQNSAAVDVKFASRTAASLTSRSATALRWTVTTTQWSGSAHRFVPRARLRVGLYHLAPRSTTWTWVSAVTTSTAGTATVTLAAPKAGSYRFGVLETSTVWPSTSAAVQGRR